MLVKTKIRRLPYSFLLVLLYSISAYAQIPRPSQSLQSPTTASLGAYGDVPVSLFTGKPSININLHTISEQGMQIPITLNYDASGVRPDVHPGWVGLNWNLSANFAVIRTMRDGPDDHRYKDSRGKLGYAFTANLVNDDEWKTPNGMTSIVDNSHLGYDMEPDEYSFNLPDISGKFYIGHDKNFKIQCDRPVKVEWISTTFDMRPPFIPPTNQVELESPWITLEHYREHAKGFYITDEFGTRYEFGGTNAFAEYSIDFFGQGVETWNVTSWQLRQIKKSTGQVIDFTYERGAFVANMNFFVYNDTYSVNGGSFLDRDCVSNPPLIKESGPYNGKLISPLYLKEIKTQNYKVNFVSTTSTELPYETDVFNYIEWYRDTDNPFGPHGRALDIVTYLYPCFYPTGGGCIDTKPTVPTLISALKWRKLDKIQIQTSAGTTLKEFELSYNNVDTERLMLLKVKEKSGTKENPPYEFSYYNTPGAALPPYLKYYTDHWGFWNGQKLMHASDLLSPNTLAGYGTAFRSPNSDNKYVKQSTLQKIKYPTSGFTEFDFEQHTYTKELKERRWEGTEDYLNNQIAGGLRIKQIKSYDPNISSSVMIKNYLYVKLFEPANPTATKISSGILGGKSKYYWQGYQPKPNANYTISSNIFSTQSVLPATENSQGSHIGYSEVVESNSAGGWIVYKFTNFDNGYLDSAPSGHLQPSSTAYQPYNSIAYQRGKTISEEHFSQNGGKVFSTAFQYALVGNLEDYSARAERTQRTSLCNTDNWVYECTAYLIDVRKFLPSRRITTTYDQDIPANFTASTQNYTYWPNGQLYIQGQIDSRGKEIKTRYLYPSNNNDAVSIAMTTKNLVGTPTSIFNYTGTETAPVALKLQNIDFALDPTSGFYLPKKVSSGIGTVLPMTLVTDIDFLTYDSRGNLLTNRERNGLTTRLEYYGTTDGGKVDLLKKRTVSNGSSTAQSNTYDHKVFAGIQSITDANSKAIFYEYDDFGRLKNIRNTNSGGTTRASYCYNYAGQVVECTALAPTGSIAASTLELIKPEILPVNLVEFEAVKAEQTAVLTWSTTLETASDRFDIERSSDGKQWVNIGSVDAQGESKDLHQYSFTDKNPVIGSTSHGAGHSENLYRLKMIDTDGSFAYSRIRSLIFDNDAQVALFPNPVTIGDNINLLVDDISIIKNIKVYDTKGKLVHQSAAERKINIGGLGSGLYMVQITYTDGSITTHKVVKQ